MSAVDSQICLCFGIRTPNLPHSSWTLLLTTPSPRLGTFILTIWNQNATSLHTKQFYIFRLPWRMNNIFIVNYHIIIHIKDSELTACVHKLIEYSRRKSIVISLDLSCKIHSCARIVSVMNVVILTDKSRGHNGLRHCYKIYPQSVDEPHINKSDQTKTYERLAFNTIYFIKHSKIKNKCFKQIFLQSILNI